MLLIMPNVIDLPHDHPARQPAEPATDSLSATTVSHGADRRAGSTVPVAANTGGRLGYGEPEVRADTSTFVELHGITDPELVPQGGAVASDIVTLGLAARKVKEIKGPITVPSLPNARPTPTLDGLATVGFDPSTLRVTVSIDTGKLTWPAAVSRGYFDTYIGTGQLKQSVVLGADKVAYVDGCPVGNATMLSSDGLPLSLWFAEVPPDSVSASPTRYGLVDLASAFMHGFETSAGNTAQRILPAAQLAYKDQMPEIVAANPTKLNGAEQSVRFAVDHTGARAAAETTLGTRNIDRTPSVTFGANGPVMFWFTELGGTTVPFAVMHTTPAAWLEPGQRPDFSFQGRPQH